MTIDRRELLGGLAASVTPLSSAVSATSSPIILEARAGSSQATWSYNGQMPGPILRVRKGDEVYVRLVNRLTQPTTLCWHGVRIVNAMDGVGGLTQKPVMPGESFDYRFIPPDSGLFWYHPHVFPQSLEQIARGLYGALVVEDAKAPKVDGDLLVVIGDDSSKDRVGDGAIVTVDGRPPSVVARPGARLRLRLLNACAEHVALVGFENMQLWVIAIDGQPSEIFQPAQPTLPIGPGSRFEVMVDLPRDAKASSRLVLRRGDRSTQELFKVALKSDAVPVYPPVAKLADNPLLPTRIPLERSLKLDLAIEKIAPSDGSWRWSLGGISSDGATGKPLFKVKKGGAVTLAFVNKTDVPQQMHVHGHVFRVLHDLDDGWDPYWRDSILLIPGKTKHIAFMADNPGQWAIESLMLSRQVSGLAGWFEVS